MGHLCAAGSAALANRRGTGLSRDPAALAGPTAEKRNNPQRPDSATASSRPRLHRGRTGDNASVAADNRCDSSESMGPTASQSRPVLVHHGHVAVLSVLALQQTGSTLDGV